MNNVVLSKILTPLLIVAAIILFYIGTIKLFFLFLPFVIGILISKIITPVVNFMHHHVKLPNNLSTAIMIFTVIGLGAYLVYGLSMLALYYLDALAGVLPDWANAIVTFGTELSKDYDHITRQLPFDPAEFLSKGAAGLMSDLGSWATKFASRGVSFATSLPKLMITVIITMLSAFFFTKDRAQIEELIAPYKKKYFTENKHFIAFRSDVLSVIVGYIKAQMILMSVTFTICSIGLTIIGVDNPIPIGFGIGLVDALPIFGPASVYMPWIITTLIMGDKILAFKLFILYLCTTITRQILEPKVVSTQIGIHPLLTLTALYVGVKLLGAPGLILGPFTGVALIATYKRYYKKDTKDEIPEH